MLERSKSSRSKRSMESEDEDFQEQDQDLFLSDGESSSEEYALEIRQRKKKKPATEELDSEYVSSDEPSEPSTPTSTSEGGSNNKRFKYQNFLNDKETQWNLIPLLPPSYRKTSKFSNVLDLDEAFVDIRTQIVYNTEAILLEKDECIYMVSEPPGDPYYIGRIVQFIPKPEFAVEIANAKEKVFKYPVRFFDVKMNWYYRPRDVDENVTIFNSRLVYASLQQDICPINSYRGKCTVVHKDELQDVLPNKREEIVRSNVFYFESLFDRYTGNKYTVYPTGKLVNNYKKIPSFLYALEKKHRYVFTEKDYPILKILTKYVFEKKFSNVNGTLTNQNAKSFVSSTMDTGKESNGSESTEKTWDKRCQECHDWCLPQSSLECDDCGSTIHLYCMDPPLTKKPGKKTAWVCSFCIKHQPRLPEDKRISEEHLQEIETFNEKCRQSIDKKVSTFINKALDTDIPKNWFQYIGYHVVSHIDEILEDIICLPYPVKMSRYGEKYQWQGCYDKEKANLLSYDSGNDTERGTKDTATVSWMMDEDKISSVDLDLYIRKCANEISPLLDIKPTSCNFLDFIVKALINNDYNTEKAFHDCMNNMSRPILGEPTFTSDEVKKFEEGVNKYGSELRPIWKHVGTQPMAMIVRFYYSWKKTERGLKIRGKKKSVHSSYNITNSSVSVLRKVSDFGASPVPILSKSSGNDESEICYLDDSSFDTDKLNLMHTNFHCLFCDVNYSPMWYKVTGGLDAGNVRKRINVSVNEKHGQSRTSSSDKDDDRCGALCIRCARLWRRYAINWMHPLDLIKRMHGTSVASYQEALKQILDETNINKLTLSPERARKKYLEWELVQDAELITRQRYEIIKDYNKFQHMKRQSMTFHGILLKNIKRPYNKSLYTPERLHSDLSSFIAERCDPNVLIPGSITESESVDKVSKDNPHTTETEEANSSASHSQPHIMDSHKIVNRTVSQEKGSTDIVVNFDSEDQKALQLVVDQKFRNVKLNKSVINMLLSGSNDTQEQILQNLRSSSSQVPEPHPIPKELNSSYEIPSYYMMFRNGKDTTRQLKGYNALAALQSSSDTSPSSLRKSGISGRISKCGVCNKSVFNPSNGITCQNCGLRCHKSCYGKNFFESTAVNGWLCDICFNNTNPILSTIYECCLCYNNTENKSSVTRISPSPAMKPTSDGRWCHILCSLFNNDIKYGNPDNYTPALYVEHAIKKRSNQKCMICKRADGGLIQCTECPDYFHVTCAQSAKQCSLSIKKELLSDDSSRSSDTIIIDQNDFSRYKIYPVLVCQKHKAVDTDGVSYHSLTSTLGNDYMLSIFCRITKHGSTRNAILSEYMELNVDTDDIVLPDEFHSNEGNTFLVKKQQVCRSCKKKGIIFWYGPDLCHRCHVSKVSAEDNLVETAEKNTIDITSDNIPSIAKDELLEGINPHSAHLS